MLFEAYIALVRNFPSGCEGLYGTQLRSRSGLWLAVDAQLFPSFLLSAEATDGRNDIELRFVNVRFSRECRITIDGGDTVGGHFTFVRLEENDLDLVRLFLRLLEETFCGDDAPKSNRTVGRRILELANLFRQVEISPKNIVGLWGELLVISQASSRENAARWWSMCKNSKYDFICDEFALEVKATLKPLREHRFSLEQLRPLDDLTVFVASVQLVQAHGGKGVHQLIDGILAEITDADLRKAFLSLCLIKGGEDIYQSSLRFQLLSREVGIAYYEAADIPVPLIDANAPVSGVTFDVRLDGLPRREGSERKRIVDALGRA